MTARDPLTTALWEADRRTSTGCNPPCRIGWPRLPPTWWNRRRDRVLETVLNRFTDSTAARGYYYCVLTVTH